jgi:HAD superfamily hydrolase (TIGR01509 family)
MIERLFDRRRLNAVVVDFDGTLVDTMPLHYEAYRRTFSEMGLDLTPDEFYPHIGGTGPETIPKFLGGRATSWSVAQIHDRKKLAFLEILNEVEIPQLPAARLLPLLHGRVPMAVSSSGARIGVLAMIERLGWNGYFDAVVTAGDAARGKPAPDLFLKAAELLGIPPEECLVLEDTDDGAAAGRAAGAVVIDLREMTTTSPGPRR